MVVVCLSLLSIAYGFPPSYTPALQNEQSERDIYIERYFNLGMDYAEILIFLAAFHGIQLSLRQLKRILFKKGYRRRKNHDDLVVIL